MDRLEKTDWVRQRFAPEMLCPAAGQGALAIECRVDDRAMHTALQPLEDDETRRAITAERSLLAALGGGCEVPIGAYCRRRDGLNDELSLLGVVASADGKTILRGEMHHSDPLELATRLAQQLLAEGAAEILGLKAAGV